MATSAPVKILVGISLDPDDSKEVLSWAIRVLTHPNDEVVALHVLVGKETKKRRLMTKDQEKFRQAKAHVISVLGEFAKTCQSKQVNLEARVGFSCSVRKGLIEEAKSISADFLLLRGSKNSSKKTSNKIKRYCLKHAPEGCSVVAIRKSRQPSSDSIPSQRKVQKLSPMTVLEVLEDDSCSSRGTKVAVSSSPKVTLRCQAKAHVISVLGEFAKTCQSKQVNLEARVGFSCSVRKDNIAGRGGYSEVYRGDLPDGRAIAVKRLANDNKDETKEKEFLTELGIIGHVCHPNTATLVGCCIENGLYLIFNFSEKGTLASALHGDNSNFLFQVFITCINAVIPIEGTFGYLAPEYFMHGIVDEKIDVFAFGVLLLEIITGRRPVDSSKQSLLLWAKPLMESGNITELADPKLKGKYDEDEMHRTVLTACYCVRQSAWRPSMSEDLKLLMTGHDSDVQKSWRMPKFTSDDLDDYSRVFGYEVPLEEEIL
ncbi:putative receptor-like serine/threonine-protein kinase isoform X2 [Gossypium australe]|uniref:Putative receptor-like serine/threonine-protein kinase isoform X2 n=1 Tax=Gossypium australe TaxID=47621 RepID=A0A5B6VP86_9ROSI|nr:putative receptor-like serine/threonine-protein kinase isoform X2 [Gossypium australe]